EFDRFVPLLHLRSLELRGEPGRLDRREIALLTDLRLRGQTGHPEILDAVEQRVLAGGLCKRLRVEDLEGRALNPELQVSTVEDLPFVDQRDVEGIEAAQLERMGRRDDLNRPAGAREEGVAGLPLGPRERLDVRLRLVLGGVDLGGREGARRG